jgi:hypothetical protein
MERAVFGRKWNFSSSPSVQTKHHSSWVEEAHLAKSCLRRATIGKNVDGKGELPLIDLLMQLHSIRPATKKKNDFNT